MNLRDPEHEQQQLQEQPVKAQNPAHRRSGLASAIHPQSLPSFLVIGPTEQEQHEQEQEQQGQREQQEQEQEHEHEPEHEHEHEQEHVLNEPVQGQQRCGWLG
jgi:hypothetical protein